MAALLDGLDDELLDDVLLDPLLVEPAELDDPESLDFAAAVVDSLAAVFPESDDEPESDFSDLSPPLATVLAAPDRESVR